jgi:hypothetical protein
MTTITIPKKEYQDVIRGQRDILSRLDFLQKVVIETSRDEIDPRVILRLEKISSNLDKGKGKRFSSITSFKNYLKKL